MTISPSVLAEFTDDLAFVTEEDPAATVEAFSTRKHRVTQWAVVDGKRDHLNFGLTEGRDRIRSARRHADTFHPYEFTDRNGTPMHVAYARYLPGSTRHGYGRYGIDVTYVFELTSEAIAASFGLAPTN